MNSNILVVFKKFYDFLDAVQKPIIKHCRTCEDCCRSYAWALDFEVQNMTGVGLSMCRINQKMYAVNSFPRDKNGQYRTNSVPHCIYSRRKSCMCYSNRPAYCRLYPLIPRPTPEETVILEWDFACHYIQAGNIDVLHRIETQISEYLNKAPRQIIKNLENFYAQIYSICPGMIEEPRRRFHSGSIIETNYRII